LNPTIAAWLPTLTTAQYYGNKEQGR